jgi:hypothetical protein
MSKVIEISDEAFEKLKDQLTEDEQVDVSSLEDLIGKKVFIRTVTYHCTGEITKKVGGLFELKDAAWIADTGRFTQFIKNGELSSNAEVEPVGKMWVNISAITDMFPWKGLLPKEQK